MDRREFVTVAKATAREFMAEDVPYMSAAVTYYAFFSLFPAIILGATIATFFVSPEEAYQYVITGVGRFAPTLSDFLTEALREVIQKRDIIGWSALISSVTLLFTASGAFDAIDKAVNRAWRTEKVPSILTTKLTSFLMMLVVGGLMLVSLIVSAILGTTRTFTEEIIGKVPGEQFFWWAVNFAASIAIVFLGLLLLYRFVPRCEVEIRDVWRGALLSAIAFALAKEGFGLFLGTTFANYNAVYGTVGTVIALLTWVYISVIIMLAGAEFAAETARVRDMRAKLQHAVEREQPRRSPWFD